MMSEEVKVKLERALLYTRTVILQSRDLQDPSPEPGSAGVNCKGTPEAWRVVLVSLLVLVCGVHTSICLGAPACPLMTLTWR